MYNNVTRRFVFKIRRHRCFTDTQGCQSIIHHWARFMEWNNETFYHFIMTALGWIPGEEKIKNADGSLTALGRRRELTTTFAHELHHRGD